MDFKLLRSQNLEHHRGGYRFEPLEPWNQFEQITTTTTQAPTGISYNQNVSIFCKRGYFSYFKKFLVHNVSIRTNLKNCLETFHRLNRSWMS